MDLETLDLRKLRAFLLVARYGGLRPAADQLNQSVSAISFSIRRLEEELGVELFRRLPNRLELTPVGERFVQSGTAIFDEIGKVLADPGLGVVPRGRLSISVMGDMTWFLIPRISRFLKRYPDVEVRIRTNRSGEILRLVEQGDADLGIGRFMNVSGDLEVRPIIRSTISLVCPLEHPLARSRRPTLQQIARHKLITLPERHSTRQLIETAFARKELHTTSIIEVSNCQSVRELILEKLGIGLVHTVCTSNELWKAVHHRSLDGLFDSTTFSAVYRKHVSSPGLSKLLEECISAAWD